MGFSSLAQLCFIRGMMKVEAKTKGDNGELWLYGPVGNDGWSDDGITAKQVAEGLATMRGVRNLSVYLNSPGGAVSEGLAIYNQLSRFNAAKTCYIDGIAASIATVIMMGCNEVEASRGTMLMVHNPSGFSVGTADEMRAAADVLDKFRDTLASVYVAETSLDLKTVTDMMDAETWMTAEEALAAGFVDRLGANKGATALYHPLLTKYKRTPDALRASAPPLGADPRALRLAAAATRIQLQRSSAPSQN